MSLHDDDGEWIPALHIDNAILIGLVVFMIVMTVTAIKLWY